MASKWTRVRPGLYWFEDEKDGFVVAMIERGGETSLWWWRIRIDVYEDVCGCERTLQEAKDMIDEVLA